MSYAGVKYSSWGPIDSKLRNHSAKLCSMDPEDIAKGSALLARFESGGFTTLVNDELRSLGAYLENEATETARAGPLLLSQILGFVDGFFREQNEYGGVQVDFVHQLDNLARTYFAATATADASESTRLAREFSDEVRSRIQRYTPSSSYDPAE